VVRADEGADGGFLVMTAIVPMAIAGYLLLVVVGLSGPTARGRAGVRALDHFVNATIFNGYAWGRCRRTPGARVSAAAGRAA
jgi:hypothetical protein